MTSSPAPGTVDRPRLPATARGVASAVGSMPGTDPHEAAVVVAGELADLPALPELPARGPGADLVGRACALLPDLPVDREPSGWRLTGRPGADLRRAAGYLSHDLDAFEEALAGRIGAVKVAVAGPWTIAAALQLPRGEPVLADAGAVRDVHQALAAGVADHLDDVGRRHPGSPVVLQLDEPSLPAVRQGRVRSFSGARMLPAPAETDVVAALGVLVDVASERGVVVVAHCCAADPPVALLRQAGVAGVSVDLTLVTEADDDGLGELLDADGVLLAGVVPALDAPLSDPAASVAPVRRLWRRLGFELDRLATQVLVTPTCGLAGASPSHAVQSLRRCAEAARTLVESPDADPDG